MPAFDGVVPGLKPKERIWSLSYSHLCMNFCKEMSYRRATELINATLRRSAETLMKARTLADFVERMGCQIQGHLIAITDRILNDHDYEPKSDMEDDDPQIIEVESEAEPTDEQKQREVEIAQKAEEINAQRESMEQIKDLERFPQMETSKDECCYISIDDIGVKRQKETRKDGGLKNGKYVNNTVVHIQCAGGVYCLTAASMENAFRMLVAFLLSNNLLQCYPLVFLADGAQDIRAHIDKYFSIYPYTLILDWYHLRKKCKELISSSIKGTVAQKKEYAQKLLRMLWVGNVNEAVAFLNGFDASHIKSYHWLGVLTKYLERKKPQIACYALRHEFGLRISSNRVEKANDILIAKRQKHNGMSWSSEGSGSLAVISMIMTNGDTDNWLRTHSLPFTMPERKAS